MIHDAERVERIRKVAAVEGEWAAQKLGVVKDSHLRERLTLVKHWADDVEAFFLSQLLREQRTPDQEAYWLGNAEVHLELVIGERKKLEEVFKKFGDNAVSIG